MDLHSDLASEVMSGRFERRDFDTNISFRSIIHSAHFCSQDKSFWDGK
jgi:hypothetical protein